MHQDKKCNRKTYFFYYIVNYTMLTEQQLQQLQQCAVVIKQSAENLIEAVTNITAIMSNNAQPIAPVHPKEILLLALLKAAGETVTREEFHKLGTKVGYDVRGMAALYAYAPNNTVTKLAGDKVGLTPTGSEKIEKYSEWLAEQKLPQ